MQVVMNSVPKGYFSLHYIPYKHKNSVCARYNDKEGVKNEFYALQMSSSKCSSCIPLITVGGFVSFVHLVKREYINVCVCIYIHNVTI